MKTAGLLFLFTCLIVFGACAQQAEWKDFRFGPLEAVSSRDIILKTLGKPLREYRPQYECGFFSEDEQGKIYWVLDYGYASFVGNAAEGFVPEKIDLTRNITLQITYKGQKLEAGNNLLRHPGSADGLIRISLKGEDAVLLFTFKNGKPTEFEYWTPC